MSTNSTSLPTAAMYASALLGQVSETSAAASLMPIHTYLPLPPLTLIHALVVSHNSLLICGYFTHNKDRINLATSIAFNQLLLFGPLSVISAMLAQPCPLLIAPEFVYIYAGVHIFSLLSGLASSLITLTQTAGIGLLIDAIFALVDAFARMDGMAGLGVETVRNHPNPIISDSPFAALLIGWAVGVGSLLMLGIISFESTQWTVRTPTWLQDPLQLFSADYISSFLATLAYYISTISRKELFMATRSLNQYIQPIVPYATSLLQLKPTKNPPDITTTTLLIPAEARALGAIIVFTFSFGNRLKRTLESQLAGGKKATSKRTATSKSSKTGSTISSLANGLTATPSPSKPNSSSSTASSARKRRTKE